MSEYQRYEFMTIERPLTSEQLREVSKLSSHIEATSTHALIEYHWGDFKHDPLDVLYSYFDGFLYWANWGAPRLAFRFPHGVLSADLLDGYDLDEFVSLVRYPDFDILDIHFDEMEGPDEWIEYELSPLIPLREELMAGDMRALYLVWLAVRELLGDAEDEEDYPVDTPPMPAGLGTLTSAQQALAELLRIPPELIGAAAQHSTPAKEPPREDFAALLELLSPERRMEYLAKLANGEPGLRYALVRELRALRPAASDAGEPAGEHVAFAALSQESQAVKERLERERRKREIQAQERRFRQIHKHQDEYWQRATDAVERSSGAGYDEATNTLVELREVAAHFGETPQFLERFRAWALPHRRRPAFVKRLEAQRFKLPEA